MSQVLTYSANKLIPPPQGATERKFKLGVGKTKDIINVILFADTLSAGDTKKFALANFRDSSSWTDKMRKLWKFVRSEIRYKEDERGYERVKSPSKTWKDRYGDCKSMSIFIGSVLQNLGIEYHYRFVSFAKHKDVTHVYVIAHTKEGDFILDAVYHKFNAEEKYAYKKDYKGMTQIDYVSGIPKAFNIGKTQSLTNVLSQPTDPIRVDDSPRKVATKRFFNYPVLTEGEFKLQLLDRKLELIQAYYGDPTGEVSQARQLILKSLSVGLHRFSSFTGSIPNSIQSIAKEISVAKKLVAPSSSSSTTPDSASVGDLVEKENCGKYTESVRAPWGGYTVRITDKEAYEKCIRVQSFRDLLNKRYAEASYHLLYEFVKSPNRETAVVATKSINQRAAIDDLSLLSTISRSNFRSWTEVGIMAQNASKKDIGGPLEPGTIINYFRDGARIGEPATAAAIITAVSKLLIAALGIAATHFLTNKDIAAAQIQGFGTQSMSADECDWYLDQEACRQGTRRVDVAAVSPLLLLGAGAFFFLNK